jgi:hypothetical protein
METEITVSSRAPWYTHGKCNFYVMFYIPVHYIHDEPNIPSTFGTYNMEILHYLT